jgi:hypothetical protein
MGVSASIADCRLPIGVFIGDWLIGDCLIRMQHCANVELPQSTNASIHHCANAAMNGPIGNRQSLNGQ